MRGSLAGLVLMLVCGALAAGEPDPEMVAGYEEVVRDLVGTMIKDPAAAPDAAQKLATLGKRAVPVVSDVLQRSLEPKTANPKLAGHCVWILARIKAPEAGKPLLALLNDDKADISLRLLAVEARSLENSPEALKALQKLAGPENDAQLRRKALNQLSLMPQHWGKSEAVFVEALGDPDDELRLTAAKACYFARIFLGASDRLIVLAEKDSVPAIRTQALLALQRMRVKKAVPALVRIVQQPNLPENTLKLAQRALVEITGVPIKDGAAAAAWWEKHGKAEYGPLEKPPESPATPAKDGAPVKDAPPAKDAAPDAPAPKP